MWYILDLMVAAIAVFSAWFLNSGRCAYFAAFYNTGIRLILVNLLLIGCLPFVLVSFMVIQWKKASSVQQGIRILLIPGIVLVAVFGQPLFYRSSNPSFLDGFRDRISTRMDIPAIRAWHRALHLPPDTEIRRPWPLPVASLSPDYVGTVSEGTGIEIRWSDGFGQCGVVIAPESMPTPSSNMNMTVLPYKPGVYFWQWAR